MLRSSRPWMLRLRGEVRLVGREGEEAECDEQIDKDC